MHEGRPNGIEISRGGQAEIREEEGGNLWAIIGCVHELSKIGAEMYFSTNKAVSLVLPPHSHPLRTGYLGSCISRC